MATDSDRRKTLQRVSVVLLFIVISAVFLRMIWGLLLAVVMAAIMTGLTYPLYGRLLKLFGGRKAAAATATLMAVIVLVVTPLVVVADVVATQALLISETATPKVNELLRTIEEPGGSLDWIPFWDQLEPYREQITQKLGEVAGAVSAFLVNGLSAAAQGTITFFFDLFIMLYSMFFSLMHGREVRDQVMRLFPLEEADKGLLLDKFVSVSRATIKGTLVIGIVHGGLAGLAFAVVGIKGAVFWGTVMAVLSIIPGIGSTNVVDNEEELRVAVKGILDDYRQPALRFIGDFGHHHDIALRVGIAKRRNPGGQLIAENKYETRFGHSAELAHRAPTARDQAALTGRAGRVWCHTSSAAQAAMAGPLSSAEFCSTRKARLASSPRAVMRARL